MTTAGRAGPASLIQAVAWLEYLDACRNAREGRYAVSYEAVELWAWKRLNQRLVSIGRRGR
jgi:hypothetical protein